MILTLSKGRRVFTLWSGVADKSVNGNDPMSGQSWNDALFGNSGLDIISVFKMALIKSILAGSILKRVCSRLLPRSRLRLVRMLMETR